MLSRLLTYAEASEHIHSWMAAFVASRKAGAPNAESVQLSDAMGRVSAAPILADRDQPPFPRATRDGFACRAADANSRQELAIVGQIRAGQAFAAVLQPGEACEIMTGAAVPEGADAVFMVEHAEVSTNFVRLSPPRTLAARENVVPRAAEARAKEALLSAGTRIAAPQIALAAQCGYAQLSVYARPRVAILSTGDELVSIESIPGSSQIRNSNTPMLASLVAASGAEPLLFPTVADQESAVDRALQAALETKPDLLLVTGGISAGRFDLVEEALGRAGAQFAFHGVAIQPGKPVAFGEIPLANGPEDRPETQSSGLPVLALPGNPISSALTFHIFAAPVIAALAGDTGKYPRFATAALIDDWHGKPGLTRFLPAHCDFALEPHVRLIPWQGSGDLAAFARSNCFLVIPAPAENLRRDTEVQILLP